jgi:hypothetical protein
MQSISRFALAGAAPRVAMVIIFAALIATVVASAAAAHSPPHGTAFPQECCRGSDVGGDCHAISPDDVKMRADGSYLIVATGERFVAPGYERDGVKAYRWSTDGQWYRCNRDPKDPTTKTFCLFVPPPGT